MCFSKWDIPSLFDNLGRNLDLNTIDQSLWSDKCDYHEISGIKILNPKDRNLTDTPTKH